MESPATALGRLVGDWEGSGSGRYPTIEPFDYRELLVVRDLGSVLHYTQRTWRSQPTGEVPSHVETGFIAAGEDGSVRLLSAHGDDRVVVLEGGAAVEDGILRIGLHSVQVAGDDRVLKTWRTLQCNQSELRYAMGMATTAIPEGAAHIEATLVRR